MLQPRVFLGSATETAAVVAAIQQNLRGFECCPWDRGVFRIGEGFMQTLKSMLSSCDFAVFVCSADDLLLMRETEYFVPRDNVILELGLFMGELGAERTFILSPRGLRGPQLPSDLSGITYGTYEPNRSDENLQAATAPFCTEFESKAKSLGYIFGKNQREIDQLAIQYAVCEWIPDFEPETDKHKLRWKRKNDLFEKLIQLAQRIRINKQYLANRTETVIGSPVLDFTYNRIGLIAAIHARPELSDIRLLSQIPIESLPDGHARIRILYAATEISKAYHLSGLQVSELRNWSSSVITSEHYVRDALSILSDELKRHK